MDFNSRGASAPVTSLSLCVHPISINQEKQEKKTKIQVKVVARSVILTALQIVTE